MRRYSRMFRVMEDTENVIEGLRKMGVASTRSKVVRQALALYGSLYGLVPLEDAAEMLVRSGNERDIARVLEYYIMRLVSYHGRWHEGEEDGDGK